PLEATAVSESVTAEVNQLQEAANQISSVVSLITDIAGQTNLLALNATIEAARAGDAGKGFAVVASEVKNLATQTSRATSEIGDYISGIQDATQTTVKGIADVSAKVNAITEATSAVAAAVEEQQAATNEITQSLDQAARRTTEVTSNIDVVNSSASEAGSAATEVNSAAGELASQSNTLRVVVDDFLVAVKEVV
ncbi:MAG: hypothetical protein HN644_00650, partial [Rhodospirillales bacterium]|nr:hypothetical protein [Rhodospirillales bacterium]